VFGSAGIGAGQFSSTSSPRGIAVNDSTGDIYVADFGNQRIDEFDAAGVFIQAWGLNVVASGPDDTGATTVEFCKASSNDVCQAGTASGQNGALQGPTGIAINQ
jgi:DNA-binding beta-propeller fold protein YncE